MWRDSRPWQGGRLRDLEAGPIAVDTSRSIGEQLATAQLKESRGSGDPLAKVRKVGNSPAEIAKEYADKFRLKDEEIVNVLVRIARGIQGDTVVKRAGYLVNSENAGQQDVKEWNDAIKRQYELYSSLYLWKSQDDAFAGASVG